MRQFTSMIYIILFILIVGCKKESESDFSYTNSKTIQYRSDVVLSDNNLISYDVYYDEDFTSLKPVMIWVHGGGWAIGDKANSLEFKKDYFESLGYVFCSVNYRLSPVNAQGEAFDILNNNRIISPTHTRDVASAISHIYQNIITYGGDKSKMILLGHSAGAHLTALVSLDKSYLADYGLNPEECIQGVANFDTEAYNITQHLLDFGVTESNNQIDVQVDNYLDNDNLTPFYRTVITYLNAFGMTETLWNEASPINYVSSSNNQNNFFFYYRDQASSNLKRVQNIESYIDALTDDNNYVESYTTSFSHETINDRIGQENEMTTNLTQFIAYCLK